MSFGFGVGDFLAVIELANKIRKRVADAPTKLRDISDEVDSLTILLSDVSSHADTVAEKLDASKAEQLKKMRDSSNRVLEDLGKFLDKYDALSHAHGSSERNGVKQIWARLNFDPGEVAELRQRLLTNITMLKFYLGNHTERNTQKSLVRLDKHIDEQEKKQILDWISNGCEWHANRQKWFIGHHEPGTRKWLFDSPEWQTWASYQGRGTTLYCPGIPGAGKTHASAMVIEKLYAMLPAHDIGVAFAFCDYQRSDEREHVDLARNLLRMILEHLHPWPAAVRQTYNSSQRSRSELDLDGVFDLLKASMQQKTRNFVVVDALDELDRDSREVLIPKLFELQQCAGLNIFITSRDIAQISDLFSGTPQLRIKATGEDIEQYISTHMTTLPSFVSGDTKLQNEIKEYVVQAAGEMFLLATLHIGSLKHEPTRKALRKALQNLSSGPDSTKEATENVMQRVINQPKQTARLALKTLMILIKTRRPLTVDELCHALAIDLEAPEDGFDEDNVPPIDYVLSSCAGLVIVESQTQPARKSGAESVPGTTSQGVERHPGARLVQVAHKSIRDYLSSPQCQHFRQTEAKMAAICRIYKEAYAKSDMKQGYHFQDYASNQWGYHLGKSNQEASEASKEQDALVQISRQGSFPLATRQANDRFGLQELALELEGMRDDVLVWACRDNKINVVDILLAYNLDSYMKPCKGYEPLVDFMKRCGHRWCPSHASQDIYPLPGTPPETDDSLLDICTKLVPLTKVINAALVTAAAYGRVTIAETLLQHGASLAGLDPDGFTALSMAASKGRSDMLEWLLGQEAMHVRLFLDSQPRLLLSMQIGSSQWRLGNPVCIAQSGSKDTCSTPIFPGETHNGRVAMTPLAAAALNGHAMCVKMLVDWMQKHYHEASMAEWKSSCMNAMLCAMERGHMAVMRTLHPFIDGNSGAPGFNGYTLLHFAILIRKPNAVEFMLADKNVDLSLRDITGTTALSLAARTGNHYLIKKLWAEGGARVDPLALWKALLEGHGAAFNILCRLFLYCNPGGFFAVDSSGYSCFDRIVFICVREMAQYNPSLASDEARRTDIENIDAFDWNPIPWINHKAIPTFYDGILERLFATLLNHDNRRPACGKAGHGDREYRFGVKSLYLALASCSQGLLKAMLQLCPASAFDIDSTGRTFLMAAFVKGSPECIGVVLKTLRTQKDTTVVNSVTTSRHSVLTEAIRTGRDDHQIQFDSLLTLPGFDLRLAFHRDEKGACPLSTLAMLTAAHTTLRPGQRKPDRRVGSPATCEKLYNNCHRLFCAVSDSLNTKELSDLFHRLSESHFNQNGIRFIDTLCSMPSPGCLELFLQSCPTLISQLDTPDAKGMTSLMHASAAWRHNEVIKFLLKTSKVDVGHRDGQGRTELSHVAENLGQFSDGGVASMLIKEYGQDPLAVDNNGWSPLCHAVSNGNVWEGSPYHDLLKDTGSTVDWTDARGSNPLHLAINGGSPLAIELLLQHPSSSSWLNATDADGLVPLAHFFLIPWGSKYMQCYGMRYPCSGTRRKVLSKEDSLKYHQGAKEAMRNMLNRPELLPDTPDKQGRTPLWHALKGASEEYPHFSSNTSPVDGGHFYGFLQSSIEALCARNDVDPLHPTGLGKTPLDLATDLATKLVQTYPNHLEMTQASGVFKNDGEIGSTSGGDGNGRAKMRFMVRWLRIKLPRARNPASYPPKAIHA